jgi:hypothetical protein
MPIRVRIGERRSPCSLSGMRTGVGTRQIRPSQASGTWSLCTPVPFSQPSHGDSSKSGSPKDMGRNCPVGLWLQVAAGEGGENARGGQRIERRDLAASSPRGSAVALPLRPVGKRQDGPGRCLRCPGCHPPSARDLRGATGLPLRMTHAACSRYLAGHDAEATAVAKPAEDASGAGTSELSQAASSSLVTEGPGDEVMIARHGFRQLGRCPYHNEPRRLSWCVVWRRTARVRPFAERRRGRRWGGTASRSGEGGIAPPWAWERPRRAPVLEPRAGK